MAWVKRQECYGPDIKCLKNVIIRPSNYGQGWLKVLKMLHNTMTNHGLPTCHVSTAYVKIQQEALNFNSFRKLNTCKTYKRSNTFEQICTDDLYHITEHFC